jgi:hypothetical protein
MVPQTRNVNSNNNFQEGEIMNETLSATDHSGTDRPTGREDKDTVPTADTFHRRLKMNHRICTAALALLPLTLTVGCDLIKKRLNEDTIAKNDDEATTEEQEQEPDGSEAQATDAEATDAGATDAEGQNTDEALFKEFLKFKEAQAKNQANAAGGGNKTQTGQAPQQVSPPPGGADEYGKPSSSGGAQREKQPTKNIFVPKGTKLSVLLSEEISTKTHKAGDAWEGSLASDVVIAGAVAWKAGSRVAGVIQQSTPTGRLANGEGMLAIRLTKINGAEIDGGTYATQGDSKGARNAKVIGTTAALGALAGVLSDKKNQKDHALGGAAIGAAVGTAAAAATGDTVIKISASSAVQFSVPSDETVTPKKK